MSDLDHSVIITSVIITGILRVIYGYVPGSRVPSYSQAELWSSVHIGMAIICACLPPLRPLFSRVWLSSVKAHYNSLRKSVSFRTRGSAQTSSNEGPGNQGRIWWCRLRHGLICASAELEVQVPMKTKPGWRVPAKRGLGWQIFMKIALGWRVAMTTGPG